MEAISTLFRQEGWGLDEQATAAYLGVECSSSSSGKGKGAPTAQHALLNADLRQVGAASLPEDINRTDNKKLAGPLVLQVSDVRDISQPSCAASESGERKGRMLRLRLTDGRGSCVGLEFGALPLALEQLCPGTKVRLQNVTVRLGVLLLEPSCFQVLGGRVEQLAEAWETQQKYGGMATERPEAADADRPPSFRHFDPKMAKYGSRRGGAARATANASATSAAAVAAPKAQSQGAAAATVAVAAVLHLEARQQQQREPQVRRGVQPYRPVVRQQQAEAQQGQQEAAAAPAGEQQQLQRQRGSRQPAPVSPQPAPAPAATTTALSPPPAAAAQKLLGRLQAEEGRYGRGQPRRGRHSRFPDNADDGSLTLEEWEARQKKAAAGGDGSRAVDSGAPSFQQQQQQLSDEELAIQLQRQLDLEAVAEWRHPPAQYEEDLAASLQAIFAYGGGSNGEEEVGYRGRSCRGGRGRRGRGGGGRGRGCGGGHGYH